MLAWLATVHQLGMLAHRKTGARLAVLRDRRLDQHRRTDLGDDLELGHRGLGTVGFHQDFAHLFVDADGCVGRGVNAAADAALDMAQGDLVGHEHDGFQAGAASLLQVVCRRFGRQGRGQHRLAHQVEVTRVLHHGAGGDVAQALAVQVEAVDQALQRGRQHVLVGHVGVDGVGAGKRDAVATDDGGATGGTHEVNLSG